MKIKRNIETARLSIDKIQAACKLFPQVGLGPGITMVYKGFIQMYKEYKKLDSHLGSRFFETPELRDVISRMKKEWKKAKSSDITKHVSSLIKTCVSQLAPSADTDESETEGALSLPVEGQGHGDKGESVVYGNFLDKLDEILEKCQTPSKTGADKISTPDGVEKETANPIDAAEFASVLQRKMLESANNVEASDKESTNERTGESYLNQRELCLLACQLMYQQMNLVSEKFSQALEADQAGDKVKPVDVEDITIEEEGEKVTDSEKEQIETSYNPENKTASQRSDEVKSTEKTESQEEIAGTGNSHLIMYCFLNLKEHVPP